MQPQANTQLPERRAAQRQTIANVRRCSVTPLQFRRVVASLEAGYAERNIAEAERIPEQVVRRIRQLELDRRNRQMSAVGTAFGGFMDAVRQLHRDIDQGIYEELREGAA